MKTQYTAEEIASHTFEVCETIAASGRIDLEGERTKNVTQQLQGTREIGQVFMMFRGTPGSKRIIKDAMKDYARTHQGY